jgi:hypothetical protein
MKIDFTQKSVAPINWLTLYTIQRKKIEFLLCEDKDTEVLETDIYKLSFQINKSKK